MPCLYIKFAVDLTKQSGSKLHVYVVTNNSIKQAVFKPVYFCKISETKKSTKHVLYLLCFKSEVNLIRFYVYYGLQLQTTDRIYTYT